MVPILCAFYATLLTLAVPVSSLWREGATLLVAVVACASYVSLLNDLADRSEDAVAGKPNRLAGRSPSVIVLLLTVPIVVGLGPAWLWRGDPLLLACYFSGWLIFTLYSLPPLRLKSRGGLGVLADAGGAHLIPTLLAVALACRGAGHPVSVPWAAAIGAWAFASGLRGILWHQFADAENDRVARVRTFAQSHRPQVITRLGTFVIFPIEVVALLLVLWQLPSPIPIAALAGYALFATLRARRTDLNLVIVVPRPRYRIVLNEYYESFLPVAVLAASALRHPFDWWVVGLHLLLFTGRPLQSLHDAWRVVRAATLPSRV